MGRRWSNAYFDREYNAWTVARHDTSRAGRAESFTTFPSKEAAERAAREENAEEERQIAARKTITHDEVTQALADVDDYRRRFPGSPYEYNWFVVRFNRASEQAKGAWKWDVYNDAVKAALAPPTSSKRTRRKSSR